MAISKSMLIVVVVALTIGSLNARCRKPEPSHCPDGQPALAGYFCGRGPTRQDCPSTHECIIAPNDAYAVCCPLKKPPKDTEKPGLCPPPSGLAGICIARCTTDDECKGKQKCCGSCPRDCVDPILPID